MPTPPQMRKIAVLIKERGIPEHEWRRPLMERWGYESRTELSVEEGGQFIDWLEHYGIPE